MEKIKCSHCGKEYTINELEKQKGELPLMIGFVVKDKVINMCKDCIEYVGALNEEETDKFFAELEGGNENE